LHPITREPRQLKRGMARCAEHGLGAARAIGSPRRVRPSSRRSMLVLYKAMDREAMVNQGGNAEFLRP